MAQRNLKAVKTAEACDLLDIDLVTLYRRIARGDQAARKEGTQWKVFVWEINVPGSEPVYTGISRAEATNLLGSEFFAAVKGE